MKYKKVPLGVEAKFLTDGTILPKVIWLEANRYTVERIVGRSKHHPPEVGCIAPLEYTLMVEGFIKKLYYEPSTQQWFSVKEIEERL